MPHVPSLQTAQAAQKVVLVRVDYNLPMEQDRVLDVTRVLRTKETIDWLCDQEATVVLITHRGRPKGETTPALSLKPMISAIENVLCRSLTFCPSLEETALEKAIKETSPGHVLLLENIRFDPGEETDTPELAQRLAHHGHLYVNEAFSVSHRAHCSVHALAKQLPAFAGFQFSHDVEALTQALSAPKRPVFAMIGGAKVSSKINVIRSLLDKVDKLIIGGNMAHFFLAAQEKLTCQNVLASSEENTRLAGEILEADQNNKIILPVDGVVAGDAPHAQPWKHVSSTDWVCDTGPQSLKIIFDHLQDAQTILWNGPFGKIEEAPYNEGSLAIARQIATLTEKGAFSIVGGGETVAVVNDAMACDQLSYMSTAGGAFLEFIEGKTLPGIEVLTTS